MVVVVWAITASVVVAAAPPAARDQGRQQRRPRRRRQQQRDQDEIAHRDVTRRALVTRRKCTSHGAVGGSQRAGRTYAVRVIGAGGRLRSRTRLEYEVERGLRGSPEPGEPCFGGNLSEPPLACLSAESEPDLLVER